MNRRKDDMGLYSIHLFAGAGGGILADSLLGHTPICAVEIEDYPRRVLLQRQLDGLLPVFPIWDDVTTFRDDNPACTGFFARAKEVSRELVICGGFPCQDISSAGKGAGITGARSGLWSEFARIIGEVRPRFVFVENSPILTSRGLGRVLGDLAALGYDAEWCVLGAKDAGAPHKRDRIWVLAHAQSIRHGQGREIRDLRKADGRPGCPLFPRTCGPGSDVAHTNREGLEEWGGGSEKAWSCAAPVVGDWWAVEPPVGRLVDGFPGRVDQLKALGNAQVPAVAALAWETLMARVIGH